MGKIARFELNLQGRDFVVGDIHGCFDLVLEALREVRFDRDRDRLFSVGDTVDRGPGSPRSRAFLDCRFAHAIRGNHEDMFLEIYEGGTPSEDDLRAMTRHNGMSWWCDLPAGDRDALLERFRRLPLAIEVQTQRGSVGLVHAEVPRGMTWDAFAERIEAGCPETTKAALWGRDRIGAGDATGVPGIGRVFCGHTPIERPSRAGNVYYLDTGAVFGLAKGDHRRGRLTMANLTEGTRLMAAPARQSLVDARDGHSPDSPFGAYAS